MFQALKHPFFLLFAILLTGCNTFSPNHNNIIRYNESKGIPTLDPAYARNYPAILAVVQLYNGLLQLDDSLNIKPCIAKKYVISENGTVYTFTLRNDVFFHDSPLFAQGKGRKVTASDFIYSFLRVMNKTTASPGSWVFNGIDTTKANHGFEATNDTTLKIYLKVPNASFAGILTNSYCFVVPHEVVDYYKKDFGTHPVGTGAFKLKLWQDGEKLVLLKNPSYFETDKSGKHLPYLDGISISFVADKQSEFMMFIKGNIDFIIGVNASFKDELINMEGNIRKEYKNRFYMLKCPYLNTEYLGFQLDNNLPAFKNSPLHNLYIRQAINMAIDRKNMIQYLRNNLGYPAEYGFTPNGMPDFEKMKTQGYSHNPDSAMKLLAKAGFPQGAGLKPFKLFTSSDYLDLCEFIQHELEKINITCNIEVTNGLAFRDMIANNKMEMFRASWIADYPDPENYLSLFYSKNFSPAGSNYTHFSDESYDLLYEKALKTVNLNERYLLYRQMDSLIIANAAIVPLFYDVAVKIAHKKVQGLSNNPLNLIQLKYASKQ